jgi:RND family efflux transporter MFP subunit
MSSLRFSSIRRYLLLPAGALLVLAPTVLAFGHLQATAKPPDVLPPLIQVTRLTRGDVPVRSTLSGTLAPYAQAKLYAKVAGYLKAIYVDKGDRVKAGQLLAIIDAPELQAQLAGAKSKTMQMRANLVERQAGYQKALSESNIATLSFQRLHGARKQSPELIAAMEEDIAKAKADQAMAQVGTARGQIAAAQAEVASQLAFEHSVQEQLAYTRIIAPFSGVISQRFVDLGAMVQTGVSSASQAMAVVELIDPDRLRLDIHVAETDVPFVIKGTPVTIKVPAVPGLERQAAITRTSLAEAVDTRTMLAEAELPNQDHALNPGMYAQVTLQLQIHRSVLTLADEAIQRQGDKASVFILGEGSTLSRKAIELGADDGVRAEVTKGLLGGETVAVPGTEPLKEGMEVRHG